MWSGIACRNKTDAADRTVFLACDPLRDMAIVIDSRARKARLFDSLHRR
jgi:hypothetical protein